METLSILKKEIWHKDFNLSRKDNLMELPHEAAVFGIFSIVNEEPMNCRYIGETEDLQASIRELFENPPSEGLKKFMQGAWIQMLLYEVTSDFSKTDKETLKNEWIKKYQPKIDDDGEYPGYYEY